MYLGEREIKATTKKDDLVQVFFHPLEKDGEKETPKSILTSQEFIDYMQTEESTESFDYMHRETVFFTSKICSEVFEKHNMRMKLAGKILENVILSLNQTEDAKVDALFKKTIDERSILDYRIK